MNSPLSRQPQYATDIAVRSGTVLKWANYVKGWQKRYFVLDSHGVLSYFRTKDEMNGGCRGAVHIKDAVLDRVAGAMELIVSNIDQSLTFHLRFQTEIEMMQWIVSLETAQQQQREDEEAKLQLEDENILEVDEEDDATVGSYELVRHNGAHYRSGAAMDGQHSNNQADDAGGDGGGGGASAAAALVGMAPDTPAWNEPGTFQSSSNQTAAGNQAGSTPPPRRRGNLLSNADGEVGKEGTGGQVGSGGGSSVASFDSNTPAGHHNRGGSSAQSESATSHGSATSAPLSEISEWGDAQDESDSETDDEGGNGGAGAGRRKGWNKVLPQAREIETLEKMLMRVQEMRRHFYKETEAFRKLAKAKSKAAVPSGEAVADAEEEEARAAVHSRAVDVVSAADELLLRASDHFRELGYAFSKSEQNVATLQEQVSVLHSDYVVLRQQSGELYPAMSTTMDSSTLSTPTTSPIKPAARLLSPSRSTSYSNSNSNSRLLSHSQLSSRSNTSGGGDASIYMSPQNRSGWGLGAGGEGMAVVATSSPAPSAGKVLGRAAMAGDGAGEGGGEGGAWAGGSSPAVKDGSFMSPERRSARPASPSSPVAPGGGERSFRTPPPAQYDSSSSPTSTVPRDRLGSGGGGGRTSTGKRRSSQGGRRRTVDSMINSPRSGGSGKLLPCGTAASAEVDLLLGLGLESLPQRVGAREPGAAVSSVPVVTSTSFWGSTPSVDTVDAKLADSEKSNLSHKEEAMGSQALRLLSVRHKESLGVRDLMQVVRGYENAKARSAETSAAARKIALWREEIGFSRILQTPLAQREEFHLGWTETVYGEDRYGHPLIGLTVRDVDAEKLKTYPQEVLERPVETPPPLATADNLLENTDGGLVAQKLAGYRAYMEYLSCSNGEQRYKVSYLIDLEGAGMSAFMGETKNTMQKIFGIGGNYFPESVWKIYCYNTPMAVRMGWSVVKAMIHPNTQAKVKILGSASAAIKLLKADGFLPEALPDKLEGRNKGLPCVKLLEMLAQAKPKATFGSRRSTGSPRDKGGGVPRAGRRTPSPN